jgi:hypothetical protein
LWLTLQVRSPIAINAFTPNNDFDLILFRTQTPTKAKHRRRELALFS